MSNTGSDTFKTLRGLPEALPEGEHLIWQCSPSTLSVARHALFASWFAVYFTVLTVSAAIPALQDGATPAGALAASWHLIALGVVSSALVVVVGTLIRKSTVYSITNKRVVMQIGMALPLTLNLPFHKIASADVKLYGDGSGDIALTPAEELPVNYAHLWPHVRGLHLRKPRPALRSVENANDVAALLVRAMIASGVKGERHALPKTTGMQNQNGVDASEQFAAPA